MNTKFFRKLIERYLEGQTTADELKLLINYYESFQKQNDWVEELGPENTLKERMLFNILDAIKDEDESVDPKVKPLFKTAIFKYAIAASFAVLLASYLLLDNFRTVENPINTVVIDSNISVGTDKAVLTREDGSTMTLNKGESFSVDNIESNGEELIYSKQNNKVSKTAYNYLTIPRGGQYSLMLEDGTKVWLNSESKLKYPVAFEPGKDRAVELLYGEAYFDVTPSSQNNGAKFTVNNNNYKIEVLGTEFNIKAYNDESFVTTTLVHGKVGIDYQDKNYLLLPNQQSILDRKNNTISFNEVDVYDAISWRNGEFSFNNKSLKDIMTVLSRWYDFKVEFKNSNIEREKFVGVLGKNEKIEIILENLRGLEVINNYEIIDKKIIIE